MHDAFMPHGMCYLWEPELLWMHVLSDGVVALSYFLIPPGLVVLTLRARRRMAEEGMPRARVPFETLFWGFAAFIVSCGITHVMGVITVWQPIYWISGSAKALTAGVSAATAVVLWMAIPDAAELFASNARAEARTRELEETNQRLEAMARQVEAAHEARRQAVSTMAGWLAHDLNNRLQSIQGGLGLMETGGLGPEELAAVKRDVRRAANTINNLQVMAGVANAPRMEPVPVREVLQRATPEGMEHRVFDRTPEGFTVRADPRHLRRILGELVENGLTADPTGPVTVHGEVTPEGPVITVFNRAPGLNPDDLARSFEPFFTTTPDQSGLGVTIAARLATSMGAELSARLDQDVLQMRLRLPPE